MWEFSESANGEAMRICKGSIDIIRDIRFWAINPKVEGSGEATPSGNPFPAATDKKIGLI